MARTPHVTIAGITFATKGELQERVRDILNNRYPLGRRIDDPVDHAIVLHVAALHPHKTPEWFDEIEHFRVLLHGSRTADRRIAKARAFYAVMRDGTISHFSYRKCLGLASSKPAGVVTVACRAAVDPDIHAFKVRNLTADSVCPISGRPLDSECAHVDHGGEWPFARIRDVWLDGTSADLSTRDGPGGFSTVFADPGTAEEFRRFHLLRALLRLIHRDVNLREGARGYRTPAHAR